MIYVGDDFGIDVDYAEYALLIIDLGDDVFVHVVYAEHCQLWKTLGMTTYVAYVHDTSWTNSISSSLGK